MITALNEVTNLVQDVNATSEGRLCAESVPKYADLGEIISGEAGGAGYQLAASAIAYSSIYPYVSWVNAHVVIHKATASATFVVYAQRIDSTGQSASVNTMVSSQTGNGNYNASSVTNFPLGHSVKYAVQNTSGSAANFWLRVQQIG